MQCVPDMHGLRSGLMSPSEVRARVLAIVAARKDNATAHSLEDSLYFDILRDIALGVCVDPRACAAEALATKDVDFARWTA